MIPLGVVVLAASIAAQDVPVHRTAILESLDRHAGVVATSPPPAQSRDSVVDGALKGILLGALAGGAAWYGICRVMDDSGTGSGDCWESDMVLGVLVGAGLGGGIGVGIDAAYMRGPRVRFVIRF
jgi:hypothetical protein